MPNKQLVEKNCKKQGGNFCEKFFIAVEQLQRNFAGPRDLLH